MDSNNKKWLYNEYVVKKRNCVEMGKQLNKDAKTIHSWLRKNDIPTRPRGGASSSGSFKKGTSIWNGRKHKPETKEKIRQARIRDGHVPYLKNGIHWLKHEGVKNGMWKGGITPERQSVYSSIEWSNAVKAVWKRDNATCQRCKIHQSKIREKKFNIHHIVSFMNKDLRTNTNNLILLCYDCHKWVHSKKNINKEFIKLT